MDAKVLPDYERLGRAVDGPMPCDEEACEIASFMFFQPAPRLQWPTD
ncbi:hypothetical protein [Lysobacter gummosus]